MRGNFLRMRNRLRAEDGAVTIPTIVWLPLFIMILLFGVELMMLNMRQVLFDRAIDMATRQLRIGATILPTHDELKSEICGYMRLAPDCTDNLAVEVFPVDTDAWTLTAAKTTLCTDATSDEVLDPTIDAGTSNQMIMISACLKLKPMSYADPLAMALHLDGAGQYALYAATVFINEPR